MVIAEAPPWSIVLNCEREVRKQMMKDVIDEGMTIATGLKAARRDSEIKERYPILPLTLLPRLRGAGGRNQDWNSYIQRRGLCAEHLL